MCFLGSICRISGLHTMTSLLGRVHVCWALRLVLQSLCLFWPRKWTFGLFFFCCFLHISITYPKRYVFLGPFVAFPVCIQEQWPAFLEETMYAEHCAWNCNRYAYFGLRNNASRPKPGLASSWHLDMSLGLIIWGWCRPGGVPGCPSFTQVGISNILRRSFFNVFPSPLLKFISHCFTPVWRVYIFFMFMGHFTFKQRVK